MIVREWRAQATGAGVAAYRGHFCGAVLPVLRRLRGFHGAVLLYCPLARDCNEIVVQTRWRSLASIRAFAGPDIDRAVVEPAAVNALRSWHAAVRHYEVMEEVFR